MEASTCEGCAFKVKGLVDDINKKLSEDVNRKIIQQTRLKGVNETETDAEQLARENLIRIIFNGFQVSLSFQELPKECNSILRLMNDVVDGNLGLPRRIELEAVERIKTTFKTILADDDAVYIINEVQKKLDLRKKLKGGMRSSKKRSTSAKRKSIKRATKRLHRRRRATPRTTRR